MCLRLPYSCLKKATKRCLKKASKKQLKPDHNRSMKVTLLKKPGRKSPWGAQWRLHGKRYHKYFSTRADRDVFVRELQTKAKYDGIESISIPREDQFMLKKIKDLCGEHTDPLEAIRYFLEHGPKTNMLLEDGLKYFHDFREKLDLSLDTYRHDRNILGRFQDSFEGRMLHSIDHRDIQSWLNGLPYDNPTTVHNYRKTVKTFLNWCVKQEYIAKNPCDLLAVPKKKAEEVKILSVEEIAKVFELSKDEDPQLCALMAIGFFSGLRSSSVERLEPQDIDLDERMIIMEAGKFKTGKRHLIDGGMIPETLWTWLERVDMNTLFTIKKSLFNNRRKMAFAKAGITKIPHNLARHSFASYHCALEMSASKTAMVLGHTSEAMLWNHYKGIATKTDAKKYFAIKP